MRPPSDDPLASLHQPRRTGPRAPESLREQLPAAIPTVGVLVLVVVLIGAVMCGAHPGQ